MTKVQVAKCHYWTSVLLLPGAPAKYLPDDVVVTEADIDYDSFHERPSWVVKSVNGEISVFATSDDTPEGLVMQNGYFLGCFKAVSYSEAVAQLLAFMRASKDVAPEFMFGRHSIEESSPT